MSFSVVSAECLILVVESMERTHEGLCVKRRLFLFLRVFPFVFLATL